MNLKETVSEPEHGGVVNGLVLCVLEQQGHVILLLDCLSQRVFSSLALSHFSLGLQVK